MVCVVLWCEAHWGRDASSSVVRLRVVGDAGVPGSGARNGRERGEKEEFQGDVAISDRCCRSARLTISPPIQSEMNKGQSGVCLVDGIEV